MCATFCKCSVVNNNPPRHKLFNVETFPQKNCLKLTLFLYKIIIKKQCDYTPLNDSSHSSSDLFLFQEFIQEGVHFTKKKNTTFYFIIDLLCSHDCNLISLDFNNAFILQI